MYIDESGKPDREDLSFSQRFYILAAVSFDPGSHETAIAQIKEEFTRSGNQVRKSSKQNLTRIVAILNRVQHVAYKVNLVIVDKELVGQRFDFQYRNVVYNFTHGLLLRMHPKSPNQLEFLVDRYGNNLFQKAALEALASQRWQLFSQSNITFVESPGDFGLLLADLWAGAARETLKLGTALMPGDFFYKNPKTLGVHSWPTPVHAIGADAIQRDDIELHAALEVARALLEQIRRESGDLSALRTDVLARLMYEATFAVGEGHVPISRLVAEVTGPLAGCSRQWFCKHVIGYFRDQGIVLVGTAKGIKLATSTNDFLTYASHVETIVGPMLQRFNRAADALRLDGLDASDLVDGRLLELADASRAFANRAAFDAQIDIDFENLDDAL